MFVHNFRQNVLELLLLLFGAIIGFIRRLLLIFLRLRRFHKRHLFPRIYKNSCFHSFPTILLVVAFIVAFVNSGKLPWNHVHSMLSVGFPLTWVMQIARLRRFLCHESLQVTLSLLLDEPLLHLMQSLLHLLPVQLWRGSLTAQLLLFLQLTLELVLVVDGFEHRRCLWIWHIRAYSLGLQLGCPNDLTLFITMAGLRV